MKIKKSELESILLTISTYNAETQQLVGGLLKEELTLGTKRKLQKIHKALLALYQELVVDIKEIRDVCGEDKSKYEKEAKILLEEEIEISVEPVLLSAIENISTSANYNFELIEKIAI
jgi:hypothetical protein